MACKENVSTNKKRAVMKKWICKVCGYVHEGEEPPVRCPECGAAESQFQEEIYNTPGPTIWGIVIFVVALLGVVLFFFSSCSSQKVDNSPVKAVELERYLGKWYELARFDHRFERGMEKCTATYTLKNDGNLVVTNRGVKNGEWKQSVGKGKTTDDPGILRVSFFGPFYSDYRIMMLAPDYSYALVGGSSDNYLWILSRTPQLKDAIVSKLLHEAQRRGYDTTDLLWIEQ